MATIFGHMDRELTWVFLRKALQDADLVGPIHVEGEAERRPLEANAELHEDNREWEDETDSEWR